MNALLILGNQLFSPGLFRDLDPKETLVFMREDTELCTHFEYHKHKIIFFLSAMRKYAIELEDAGYKVHYQKLGPDKSSFEIALEDFLKTKKIKKLFFFEIEDKFFETRIQKLAKSVKGLEAAQLSSPMFLTTRAQFSDYLKSVKKPFMKTFYESQRKRLNVLVDKDGKPTGGQWSFDEDNRQPLPKNYEPPALPAYKPDAVDKAVQKLVDENFGDHVGNASNIWLPTTRASAQKWLEQFLEERLANFGPYEDALSKEFPFVHHSVLTPFLNVGLLTPKEVVQKTLKYALQKKTPLASLEGFLRQIIGWREFIRGIYQNYGEVQEATNFWKHKRKLKKCWYDGTTGIEPLDDVIKKTQTYAYAHHIERLMIVGSLMLILEIEPTEAYKWFMEMFIDSSDWVMGPNVFGMALFSDGGIFATKPYFCGSNYYKKMGLYKKGDWQAGVDGLYWGFIDRNRQFFAKNPRMSMMVKTFDKMDAAKKKTILTEATALRNRITSA